MKSFILLIAACASVVPLSAQNEGPANDLIELFKKSQREGASDEELMRMLENKTLMDRRGSEIREVSPEELQREKDAMNNTIRRLKNQVRSSEPERAWDDPSPRRKSEVAPSRPAPGPPRWLVGLVVNPLDPALRSHFNLPGGSGVIVASVMRGSPAAAAGIRPNDILVTANERKVSSLEDLKTAVAKSGSEGKTVKLDVIQRGKRSTLEVKPRGPEAPADSAKRPDQGAAMRSMLEIQHRLDQQQKEIEALRLEIRKLRARQK